MRNFNKFWILLVSALFIFSGVIAQNEVSPTLKNLLEKQVKPAKDLQQMGGVEQAPTVFEQLAQTYPERDPALAFWPNDIDVNAKKTPIPSDDMFDLQFDWPVGIGGGEAGIETDGNYIYTTKWNGSEFYQSDLGGNYLATFTCGTAGAIRDLAYDGTYFYGGAASPTVFQMDFDAQTVVSTFSAPTDVRAIAYNEDDDAFYANNWGSNITKFDITGANLGSWSVGPVGDSYYGFAYDNYCGGTFLWGYAQVGTTLNELIQMSLPDGAETGVYFDVGSVAAVGTGIAGGMAIDDNLWPGFWTIFGTSQNVNIWGLELCTSGPPLTVDVGVQSIVEPSSGVDLTSTEPVTVTIKNFGTDPQSNFDVWFEMDGGGQVVETITTTINSGESIDHTFAVTVDLSAYGTYEFESCTDLAGDENPNNDCKIKSVENSQPSQSFCMPTYSTGCDVGDGFTDFAVEQIQNLNNGCENNTGFSGWSEYYELGPAILLPGLAHTFTLGTGFPNQYVNIWIDFNDDMVLTPDEMILVDYWMESSGVLYDVEITIPAGATPGNHGMRAMAVYAATFTDPCGSYTYGEAEDYSVIVGVPDYGSLEGYVTENTGGAPIDGAMIAVNNGIWTGFSGSDGYYEITDVLVGDWPVDCTKDGYNPAAATVNISVGTTTQQDFAMTSPTMEITPTAINIIIDPNTQATEYIDIANNGDGLLGWNAQLEMLTDDAWDLQFSFDVEIATGALGNAGAECDGQYYYTTRWASNLIHKFDLDGILIEEFSIPGVSGLRDLAFDGTYMYGGAAANTIYEMDFVSQTMISTIASPQQVRSIAYDDGNDAFWCANWATDITLVSKAGATLNAIPATTHGLLGIYGTAYDTWSTGSPLLWIFDQGAGAGTAQLIHEADLNSLTMTGFSYDVMADLGPNASAIAGGLFVVPNVYSGILSIGGLLQGTPDVFFMYELAPAQGLWITIDPSSGDVDPGNIGIMDVNFDATDIVPGTVKTANIHFTSDPDVGTVTVPVSMTVGNLLFGYIEGNVFLDGSLPYNIGDVTEVLVEAGPYSTFPVANGDYQITVYPGTFDVVATLYGYDTQTAPGIVVAEGATVTGIDFTLPILYGRLMGTVTDYVTGDPIENATISVIDTDFEVLTAADGTYEIIIEAGTYDVMANHPTYMAEVATDVDVTAETDTQLDFELQFQVQCQFYVVLWDDFGDGWNGGTLTISVDGTVVLNNITIATGSGPETFYFDVGSGAEITCVFTAGGWPYECSYYIYDNDDNEVFADGVGGVDPTGGTFTGTCIVFIYGDLAGTVTELGTGNPIEGAEILINDMTDETAADGTYLIDSVMIGTWDVYCNAAGYNPAIATGVVILEEQTTILDFELTAPEFTVDPLSVEVTVEPNQTTDETVNISNPGLGTVDWSAAVVVITGDNGTDEMFDLLFDWPVGVGGGEAGIETDGSYIYTTKWNGSDFYRYAMDGTYIESFTCGSASAVRDLAYDGTYFYGGAASPTVYEMDFDAQTTVSTFGAPTDCRAIGYNEDDDAFYANNWGSAITKFDKTGANLGSWNVGPVGDSYYGFAYDNYSDGAPYLWGYAQVGATLNELIQMQLPDGAETGTYFDVGSVANVGTGIAGGMAIDDNLEVGFWVFLGTSQNVNIWGLELCEAGPVWLTIDPTSGTLDPGTNEDMTLHFDAFELLPGVYEAEIHFSTTPNVGEPIVAVTMTVEGLIPAIDLAGSWDCTDVNLTWEMPTGGDPDSWNVYKDGVLLDNVTVMEYTDPMVDPGVEFSYTVTAVYSGEESQPTSPFLITVPT
ncbi:MAG: carboxypeptidase regulatory-like domain-containing protein, partial [Bacteroidales bacterium]|nr:carboxypeptidase regulatory-like domain-containing protein [Bacteroidales bacterium]